MNKGTTNTFTGLSQDTSKAKFENTKYYDALNLRIVTYSGLSSGAIETTKGTKLDFILPDIPQTTYEQNGENGPIIIPAQTDLKILGGTFVNNKVIIFSTDGNGYGQIWMFEYDESSDTIVDIQPGNLLSNSIHLKYNRFLNFDLANRIKAIAREESEKFLRVYWVDGGLNDFRSINLYNPNTQSIPVRSLDLQPNVNMELPLLKDIVNGDLPNGRIQYFYRLMTKDGAMTNFSPVSQLIDLNNGDISGNSGLYPEVYEEDLLSEKSELEKKEKIEFSSEKGIIMTLPNAVDRDYDYIQWGYVLYEEKDVPQCFLFPEQYLTVNSDGSKTSLLVHTNMDEGEFSIDVAELNNIYNVFKNPNTLTQKHNLMFLANVNNEVYNSDALEAFDARAYRFNTSGFSRLYQKDNTFYTILQNGNWNYNASSNNGTDWSIPETADCINQSNNESNVNYHYLYKKNTTTFGGSGKYVSYEFVKTDLIVDDNVGKNFNLFDTKRDAPFYKSPNSVLNSVTFNVVNQSYNNLNESYDDLTSPYKSSIFAGYARGEVYRFGIVFYNLKNQPSYVKWIGDIKFPHNHHGDDNYSNYNYFSYDNNNDKELVHPLYLEFSIDIPQDLKNEISGFSIVRVERKDEDKTKLGTALTGGFDKRNSIALDFETFKKIIVDLLYRMFKKMSGNTGFLGLFNTLFENQIRDQIENILDNFTNVTKQLFENEYSTTKDMLNAIKFTLSTGMGINSLPIPGAGVLGGLFSPMTDALLNSLIDSISDEVDDFLKRKVAGIDDNVLSLGASAYSNNSSIYTIFPEQQFNRYKYKNGDYLNVISCFNDFYNTLNTNNTTVIINPYHRFKKTGFNIRTNSTAVVKKWCSGSFATTYLQPYTININSQYSLESGEIIYAPNALINDSTYDNYYIVNSYIGFIERYTDNFNEYLYSGGESNPLLNHRLKVMGIGDKKHVLTFNNSFKYYIDNAPNINLPNNQIYVKDNQQYFMLNSGQGNNSNYLGTMSNIGFPVFSINGNVVNWTIQDLATMINNEITFVPNSVNFPAFYIQYPRILHTNGDCIVSYERYLTNQYGGNTYEDRTLNDYIEVCYIDKSAIIPKTTFKCANGDTYLGMYGAVDYNYYFNNFPGYEKATNVKKALIHCFPAEASFNFNVREGYHANNAASADDLDVTEKQIKRKLKRLRKKAAKAGINLDAALNNEAIDNRRFIFDDFVYYEIYNQQNNAKIFKAKPIIDIINTYSRNRIWMSQNKIDGEFIDKWKIFKPLDFIDVESSYGPINELTTFNDILLYFQNNAFGTVITNETSTITDTKGTNLLLASAKPLSAYRYISTESGCSHRFAVVPTSSGLFYVDVLRKKIFKFGEGLTPLSDIKGLGGKLRELCTGIITNTDSTLLDKGIHGIYYPEHNSVFFTFLGIDNPTTISYNLLIDEFESFHSFHPGLYIKTPSRIICENPLLKKEGYQLYKGNYGQIFGVYNPTSVTILVNENPAVIKTFNNLLLFSEVFDSNGNNIFNDTIDQITCYNDYQNTGNVPLIVGTNIKRIERKWNMQIPRDTANAGYSTLSKPRMRDTHLFINLSYNNNNNNRMVLHDINTFYQESIT